MREGAASNAAQILRLTVEIRPVEVLRFLGYPAGRIPPLRILQRFDAQIAEARSLVMARGLFRRLPLEDAPWVGLPLPLDPSRLSGFVLALVTVGRELEERTGEALRNGDAVAGLLLDAMGNAAAEEAADRLSAVIADGQARGGTVILESDQLPCRASPGYGDWPLTAQPAVFDRLSGGAIGVEVLPSMLMVPRKSVSFAVWLDDSGRPVGGRTGCGACPHHRCAYRRAEAGGDAPT